MLGWVLQINRANSWVCMREGGGRESEVEGESERLGETEVEREREVG